jgi:hypothetical protein
MLLHRKKSVGDLTFRWAANALSYNHRHAVLYIVPDGMQDRDRIHQVEVPHAQIPDLIEALQRAYSVRER